MAKKMSDAGQALLDDVLGIKAGMPAKIWSPEQLLVIAVRKQLQKSQPDFAKLLGIPVGTLRDWEQGRKQPDSAAVTLIRVAQSHPEVLESLAA
ncbi:type II toxin-antitoxin system MqsA family antitoxin [SAR92 clade bacterium H455]|uniref:Type II toxin-antitoxin system MqsA family antitoxin n=1 Tax=SAR92 clade bacterium H455 TaxID=2974818 RepID=A0ABY5TKW5_9GAMM|nr:type II toxin-antitoxin system MqsA family antitoxin [SAR92 clade bacterium H455]